MSVQFTPKAPKYYFACGSFQKNVQILNFVRAQHMSDIILFHDVCSVCGQMPFPKYRLRVR
jgi:hypothetical protein